MADLDWNTIMLLVIAALNFGGLVIGILTQKNIKLLETNTNSIKDALVKSTADASFAAGANEARVAAEAEAKNILAKTEAKRAAA